MFYRLLHCIPTLFLLVLDGELMENIAAQEILLNFPLILIFSANKYFIGDPKHKSNIVFLTNYQHYIHILQISQPHIIINKYRAIKENTHISKPSNSRPQYWKLGTVKTNDIISLNLS